MLQKTLCVAFFRSQFKTSKQMHLKVLSTQTWKRHWNLIFQSSAIYFQVDLRKMLRKVYCFEKDIRIEKFDPKFFLDHSKSCTSDIDKMAQNSQNLLFMRFRRSCVRILVSLTTLQQQILRSMTESLFNSFASDKSWTRSVLKHIFSYNPKANFSSFSYLI
jgi:hypothetical protein